VEGLQALHGDDATLLEQGIAMFDALARSFESDEGAVEAPKSRRHRKLGRDQRRRK
jgi:hypothetical protein